MARCCAYVDVAAYRRNLRVLRAAAGVPVFAVLKADAYGHGAVELARVAADTEGVSGCCVATIDEAVTLREAGVRCPMLVFTPVDDAAVAARHGLTVSVSGAGSIPPLLAARPDRRPAVHIEVDCGMHRMGTEPERLGPVLEQLDSEGVVVSGLYTHFSSADENDPTPTVAQIACFRSIPHVPGALRHAANSAAALRFPEARFDAVRLGGATFGLSTGADEIFELTEPLLTLEASVVRVFDLPAAEGLGYGLDDPAGAERRIAVLAIGYGDGLPRSVRHGGQVLIGGVRRSIVGRVSMDFTMVDVTGSDVEAGDRAVLIGEQGESRIRAEEVAAAAGTISYEITTGLLPRVPRIHTDSGARSLGKTPPRAATA